MVYLNFDQCKHWVDKHKKERNFIILQFNKIRRAACLKKIKEEEIKECISVKCLRFRLTIVE